MNKIKFLKFIDRIIGKPLVFLLLRIKKNHKDTPKKIKKVLFIRPGGIGDAALLLPAINSLRENFPDSEIDLLCEKRNADIFRLSKDINAFYLYDRGFGLFKCLRNRYDVVIDTEQWHRLSAVAAYLTGAPIRIGFDTNERGKLFTHRIPYSHDDYEVYSFLHLIEPLLNEVPKFNVEEPFIDRVDRTSPELLDFLNKHHNRIISIFSGATVREKRWGGEGFGKVAKVLRDKGYTIVVLGSKADRTDVGIMKKYVTDNIDLIGKTSLREVASLLRMSKLLITADSGIMHIAYGVGTPTISLFGASIEKKWAPRGKQHIVLNKHLVCSPCIKFGYTPRCKRNVECLSSINIDEVIGKVEIILNQIS